jgi:hypothetical protein
VRRLVGMVRDFVGRGVTGQVLYAPRRRLMRVNDNLERIFCSRRMSSGVEMRFRTMLSEVEISDGVARSRVADEVARRSH